MLNWHSKTEKHTMGKLSQERHESNHSHISTVIYFHFR